MADVKPFKGYRYKLNKPQDLGRLAAPPYDMLDESAIDKLYKKDDFNCVRITQNKHEISDTSNKDRHIRAADFFNSWCQQQILVQDPQPSLYIYEQEFDDVTGRETKRHTRTGIICLIKLADFQEGIVLPHEYTLSGPKQDRYDLLDAARVNTGQIFGLVSDDGDVYGLIRNMKEESSFEGSFNDENGVVHNLYKYEDTAKISSFVQMMKEKNILIADGHHRYETALNFYRNEKDERYAYTMMTFVSMADPGLVIRPFHRLIRKTDKEINMKIRLSEFFEFENYGIAASDKIAEFITDSKADGMLFLDSSDNYLYKIKLSENGENFLLENGEQRSERWKHLDVSIINSIVINRILGLPLDGKVLHDQIEYINDPVTGYEKLQDQDSFYGGFFIRPLSIRTIYDIVAEGERMPQKSTNFFPKLYSGLVFNKLGKSE